MTWSRVPKHWRLCWTVWLRVRPDHWQVSFATNDPAKAVEVATDRVCDTLVYPPGQKPIMPKGQCLKGIEL